MNGLKQRLILISHAVVLTLLMFSVPNLPIKWTGSTGPSGLKQTPKASPDNLQHISRLVHLWQPLIATFNRYRLSEVRDWMDKALLD